MKDLWRQLSCAVAKRAGRETVERLVRIFGHDNVYVELQRHLNARKNGATRPPSALRGHFTCRCWRQTASAMPPRMTTRFWMSSLRSAITPNSIKPAAFWRSITSAICEPRKKWPRCSATSQAHGEHRRTLVPAKFELTILATSFRAIRCLTAKRWTASCASASLKASTALRAEERSGSLEACKETSRARTCADREARLCRIFPHRVGHCAVLQTKRHSGAGPRERRQFGRLLCPGNHCVDPVGMELLFERFLSESRNEWPDIDLDLPSEDKREQAIQYVYQRYGELGAAMTANVITYRGKSAAVKSARHWASMKTLWDACRAL